MLTALLEKIQDRGKLVLNRRVAAIDHDEKGVTVRCEDGTEHRGDVVVGADGVHSVVRHEMWRLSDEVDPSRISDKEKDCKSITQSPHFNRARNISDARASPHGRIQLHVRNIEAAAGRSCWKI